MPPKAADGRRPSPDGGLGGFVPFPADRAANPTGCTHAPSGGSRPASLVLPGPTLAGRGGRSRAR